nr:DUF2723 domain-containing protein [Pontibacter qinzhouensis]
MYPGAGGRINWGDSIKWQYLHLANGLPHSTGYPQFLMLTELFSRIIFFLDMPERITLIAVLFGALAMVMFYSVVHLLTNSRIGSTLATLCMGFTYTFWTQATEAEVYTLNIFYLLTVFYLFLKFYYTKSNKYYLLGCAVFALSFGNHLTMVTILPALVFISLKADYRKVIATRNLLFVALFILAGISQYILVYYRAHTSNPLYIESSFKPNFSEFFGYITGSGFHSQMFPFTLPVILYERFNILFQLLNLNFTILGLSLAAAGFFYYLYQKKGYVELIFLGAALVGQLVFNINYDVPDLIVFFLPIYFILGIFIGMIFASRQTLVPLVLGITLTLGIIYISFKKKDILTANTFVTLYIRPYTSMHELQKTSYPLYFHSSNYYISMYMKYDQLTNFNSSLFSLTTTGVLPDTFYIARESEITPDLQEQHNIRLAYTENAYQFLNRNIKTNHAVFISFMGAGAANMPAEFYTILKQHGSRIDHIPVTGSYSAILYNGKIVEYLNETGPSEISSKDTKYNPLPDHIRFSINSAAPAFGSVSIININGYDYSPKRRGINFVVYDTVNNQVTDIIEFDTVEGEEKKLFQATRKSNS